MGWEKQFQSPLYRVNVKYTAPFSYKIEFEFQSPLYRVNVKSMEKKYTTFDYSVSIPFISGQCEITTK